MPGPFVVSPPRQVNWKLPVVFYPARAQENCPDRPGARVSRITEKHVFRIPCIFLPALRFFSPPPSPCSRYHALFFFFKITSVDSFLSFFHVRLLVRFSFFLIVRRTGEKGGGEKKEGRKSADMNIHKFKFTPRVTTQSDVIYIALASSLPYTSSPPAKLFNR